MNITDYFHKPLKVSEVIEIAKKFNVVDENPYSNFPFLYADYDAILALDTICYLDKEVDVDDNGEEIYPKFIQENNLWLLCQGWYFIDILDYTRENKKNFSKQDFINALNYYLQNDSYLEF
ncbi:MAG: hypothetical protein Q4B95_10120 [Lonepinella koalarum]|nr:hypothetical protein [Lonepinella koalarum]